MADEGVSKLWISADELRRLNRVCIHIQRMFLSDILSASGKILDEKYLVQRKTDDKWLKFKFPKEQPHNKDFTLWKSSILQVVPARGIMDRLGNLTQDGQKNWNWRHNEDNSCLMHYIEGRMDIYKATQISRHQNTTNRWTRVSTNQPYEINGNIFLVREVALALVTSTSTATPPLSQEMPTCFLDV